MGNAVVARKRTLLISIALLSLGSGTAAGSGEVGRDLRPVRNDVAAESFERRLALHCHLFGIWFEQPILEAAYREATSGVGNAPCLGQEAPFAFEGDLPRRADLGFQTEAAGDGGLYDGDTLVVRAVEPGSPAAEGGLTPGDLLVGIGGEAASSALHARELLGNVPGERRLDLTISRDGRTRELRFTPEAVPLEALEGVHTTYGVLTTDDGTRLRTLLTRPLGAEGPLPAILLSDWTSCDSVEAPRTSRRGWLDLVRGVVETTGAIVLRVDKPGVGDSLGLCSELDFDETVAYQRKALRRLKSRPDVDPERVFVFGESVGTYLAPLVARGQDAAGIFVYGGGAQSWFERMVAFERKQRELRDRPPAEIDAEMKRIIAFLHPYLVEGRSLERIFAADSAMRSVWDELISFNSATKHYGRPIAFHQQAQRHDFARAWVEADAPALVLFGEYDQFESLPGARTIVNAVNRARPGDAKLIVYPRMNHQLELFPTPEAAMAGSTDPTSGAELVLADVRAWLDRIVAEGRADDASDQSGSESG